MPDRTGIKIGTLGSKATFAGEATARIRERFPEFSEPLYFKSMDDCWSELAQGTVDAVVLGAERTGQPHHGHAVATRGFYVVGTMALPLSCNLYVKPGTRRETIRKITGHGSIFQCTAYLDRHFPGIPREMHGLNSVEAAKSVLAGDGTEAVVGSRSLPSVVPGLEMSAEGIDDGSISSWWVISSQPHFSDRPDALVITGQFGPDGTLGEMIAAVLALGYRLTTIAAFPADRGVSIYHYLATFDGKGGRAEVESAISPYRARLAGAFEKRG
jgi:prephenate dehydratase